MSKREGTRTGRRPGESGTRDAIADAARRRFAEVGYERATIRAIAGDAAVDPALVLHFFGSKQELFASVMALPFEPEKIMEEILAGPRPPGRPPASEPRLVADRRPRDGPLHHPRRAACLTRCRDADRGARPQPPALPHGLARLASAPRSRSSAASSATAR